MGITDPLVKSFARCLCRIRLLPIMRARRRLLELSADDAKGVRRVWDGMRGLEGAVEYVLLLDGQVGPLVFDLGRAPEGHPHRLVEPEAPFGLLRDPYKRTRG
jgi:hypothetical protein